MNSLTGLDEVSEAQAAACLLGLKAEVGTVETRWVFTNEASKGAPFPVPADAEPEEAEFGPYEEEPINREFEEDVEELRPTSDNDEFDDAHDDVEDTTTAPCQEARERGPDLHASVIAQGADFCYSISITLISLSTSQ